VPALNALPDATGNNTPPFSFAAANERRSSRLLQAAAGDLGVRSALVSVLADDGSTVGQVSTITLTSNQSVTWTKLTVTRPDSSVAQLADDAGAGAAWRFLPR
jgi:hypothetical protein